MAVKNDRVRVYLLDDVGEAGAVSQMYVRQPSTESDQGYWAGLAYISGRETTVGAQAEHVVIYDVVMDDHVPVENEDDIVIAVLGQGEEEIQFLKVYSVGKLRTTGEKIARTEDVSDENWTDRLTV
jgi:hypothetical protein